VIVNLTGRALVGSLEGRNSSIFLFFFSLFEKSTEILQDHDGVAIELLLATHDP
jgi:hypothetical protein